MRLKQATTSALLCALFLIVYGSTNCLTSLRHDVGTFYFSWERHILFVPLMIVPYMSIDLFFIAAPFLCRDERELQTLSRRIIAAILISGAFFLLLPLQFAFQRPPVSGPLGLIFNNFRLLDRPYNQFPSLHIALRTILAVLYVHRTVGLVRLATRVWFSLIGLSTVLTYQHHVIDLVGGFALGFVCLYVWGQTPLRQPVIRNYRIGIYYAIGCALLAILAIILRMWGLLLLWPAFSLAIVSLGYFALGPAIFRKVNGRVPWIARLILGPLLLGQWVSLQYYKLKSSAWNTLTDHVWIGRKLSDVEAQRAIEEGVTAVLDLTGEFTEAAPFRQIAYRQLSILDLTAPTPAHLVEAITFVTEQARNGIVYIHCKAGYSRTAAISGTYLLASGQSDSAEEVISILQECRPGIVIRPEARAAIQQYQAQMQVCVGRQPL